VRLESSLEMSPGGEDGESSLRDDYTGFDLPVCLRMSAIESAVC